VIAMTAKSDFQTNLARVCALLRDSGVPEANIETYAAQWTQKEPAELRELADALKTLEQATRAVLADRLPRSEGTAKYPNIKVRLDDLNGKAGPILRRVSYALSDADIDEAEVEQFKREVASGDPDDVARRWVSVD